MGIRPNKSGDIIVNPPDNSQSRWGDWVTGLEGAGDTAGGVVSEIDAKAESANTGSGELATALTVLEAHVPILVEFMRRPGTTTSFDAVSPLPSTGEINQTSPGTVRFTVPVLVTVTWDGSATLSVGSWTTNGASAGRTAATIPAGPSGQIRSVALVLIPTLDVGTVYLTGEGNSSPRLVFQKLSVGG